MKLSPKFEEALIYATRVHGGQLRKKTRIPYIGHLLGVTAIAIERTHLLEEREEAEVVRRGAELKAALLASLGHDLKTPLTAVTVAASNLDAAWLTDQGEGYQSLPLWTEGSHEWTLAGDPTKAIASGLSPRPLTETISDTWDWIKKEQPPLVPFLGREGTQFARFRGDMDGAMSQAA